MSKIDYDLKKIKAVVFDIDGVLSPSVVPMGSDGVPQRMANLKDGYALQLAVKRGVRIAIISGSTGSGLEARFRSLGIEDVYLKAKYKREILVEWMKNNAFTPEEVAYVGDDIPDRECLDLAGLAVAPADAAPDILGCVRYISPEKGGYGVARDLLEEILKAQGLWPHTDVAFGR